MIMLTYDEEYGEKFSENHEDDKNYDDEIIRQDLLVSNDLIIAWVNRCGTPAYQTIVKVHHFFFTRRHFLISQKYKKSDKYVDISHQGLGEPE